MTAAMLDGPLQVVFSFDTTGSMRSALTEVRGRLSDMLQRLQTDLPAITAAVVAHGDYCDAGSTCVTKHVDFTDDLPRLVDFVDKVQSTHGGGEPEPEPETYEVMSPGSQRVLVVIGDAFPHPPDDEQNKDNIDWEKETQLLRDMSGDTQFPFEEKPGAKPPAPGTPEYPPHTTAEQVRDVIIEADGCLQKRDRDNRHTSCARENTEEINIDIVILQAETADASLVRECAEGIDNNIAMSEADEVTNASWLSSVGSDAKEMTEDNDVRAKLHRERSKGVKPDNDVSADGHVFTTGTVHTHNMKYSLIRTELACPTETSNGLSDNVCDGTGRNVHQLRTLFEEKCAGNPETLAADTFAHSKMYKPSGECYSMKQTVQQLKDKCSLGLDKAKVTQVERFRKNTFSDSSSRLPNHSSSISSYSLSDLQPWTFLPKHNSFSHTSSLERSPRKENATSSCIEDSQSNTSIAPESSSSLSLQNSGFLREKHSYFSKSGRKKKRKENETDEGSDTSIAYVTTLPRMKKPHFKFAVAARCVAEKMFGTSDSIGIEHSKPIHDGANTHIHVTVESESSWLSEKEGTHFSPALNLGQRQSLADNLTLQQEAIDFSVPKTTDSFNSLSTSSHDSLEVLTDTAHILISETSPSSLEPLAMSPAAYCTVSTLTSPPANPASPEESGKTPPLPPLKCPSMDSLTGEIPVKSSARSHKQFSSSCSHCIKHCCQSHRLKKCRRRVRSSHSSKATSASSTLKRKYKPTFVELIEDGLTVHSRYDDVILHDVIDDEDARRRWAQWSCYDGSEMIQKWRASVETA